MSWPWITVLIAVSVVVVIQSVILLGLLTRIGPLLERLGDELGEPTLPSVGELVPDLALTHTDGHPISTRDLPRPSLMVIVDPHCGHCDRLLAALGAPLPSGLVVIADSSPAGRAQVANLPQWVSTFYQDDEILTRTMKIGATPAAVTLDHDLRVAAATHPSSVADLQALATAITPHKTLPLRETTSSHGYAPAR
ncbi:hypothetical protein [Nocardia sp. NPDC051832]|uniref:hypothetical protein n=1 Tax=Nocardia sp. NPDC051832 TaxID=3155673 RepID=UPI00343B45CC